MRLWISHDGVRCFRVCAWQKGNRREAVDSGLYGLAISFLYKYIMTVEGRPSQTV